MNQKKQIIVFALNFLQSNLCSEIREMMSEALGTSMPEDPEAVIAQILLELNDEPPDINQEFDEDDLATLNEFLEKCQQLEDDNLNSPSRHK